MKKYIFLAFLLGTSLCTSAQKLHALIYADTNDETIGVAARLSKNNYLKTCGEIATALTWTDFSYITRVGYECNKENLLQDIQNLDCTEKDIVIFVYCGHGSRSPIDKSDFPQMCMADQPGEPNDGSGYVSLEYVRNLIMKKNPRFCLVIGDCCNSVDPNLDPKDINPDGDPNEKTIVVEGDKCVRNLFFKKNGSVILTASRKNEYGWSNNGFGMYMQREFSNEMSRILNQHVTYSTWEGFLEKVKQNVERWNIRDKYGKFWKQHPFYRVDLREPTIKPDTIVPPAPPVPPVPPTPIQTGIREELLQIADDRKFTEAQRIAKRNEVLKEYFSEASMIDVAGKDGKTITLTMTAEDYLRRISLEEGLTNIVILERKDDRNGKIMYLELHEIYREIKRKIQ